MTVVSKQSENWLSAARATVTKNHSCRYRVVVKIHLYVPINLRQPFMRDPRGE
jgi:hypothetical protein